MKIKYSLVLLAATAVLFTACGEDECCSQGLIAPVATITQTAGTGVQSYVLDGSGTDADGNVVETIWSVNDTVVSEGYALSEVGTYEVCLTVIDNDGLSDTDCTTIEITNASPVVSAGTYSCVEGETIVLDNATATDDSGLDSVSWTNVAGNANTISNATYTCGDAGTYTNTCLTAVDDDGVSVTNCATITVSAPDCDADFVILNGSENNTTILDDGDFTKGDLLWFVYDGDADTVLWQASNNVGHTNCMVDPVLVKGSNTAATTYIYTCSQPNTALSPYSQVDVNLTVTYTNGDTCFTSQTINANDPVVP